jgi:dienelactone hydrolase
MRLHHRRRTRRLTVDGAAGNVRAVVSFHGGLTDLPTPAAAAANNTNATTATNAAANATSTVPKLLVLSGGSDDTATQIMDLERTLNDAATAGTIATWEITRFSNVQHAFTVFGDERYNELVRSL